ncbi:Uncharacterized protein FKW44_011538, partial [Caligus rogercresseyi]
VALQIFFEDLWRDILHHHEGFAHGALCNRLLSNLNALRLEGTLCDVEIRSAAEDDFVHAHKSVLAAASPYFYAMFNGGLAEKNKASLF